MLYSMREQCAAIAPACKELRLLALLSPWLGQAVWSGQEATSLTAAPASCSPHSSHSLCPGLAHCSLHAGRILLGEEYKY